MTEERLRPIVMMSMDNFLFSHGIMSCGPVPGQVIVGFSDETVQADAEQLKRLYNIDIIPVGTAREAKSFRLEADNYLDRKFDVGIGVVVDNHENNKRYADFVNPKCKHPAKEIGLIRKDIKPALGRLLLANTGIKQKSEGRTP